MHKIGIIIFTFLIQILITVAYATPVQVILIRHGEKPLNGNELSPKGWQRANALPTFFISNKMISQFGNPVALYAAAPAKAGGSIRSIQTLTPYATKISLAIHTNIKRDNIQDLVNEIMTNATYDGHTVIICWEHNLIPEIAQLFGAKDAPDFWDSNIFDRAWVLRFSHNNDVTFTNLAQNLLPGDSAQ